jgi:hypothetical protein
VLTFRLALAPRESARKQEPGCNINLATNHTVCPPQTPRSRMLGLIWTYRSSLLPLTYPLCSCFLWLISIHTMFYWRKGCLTSGQTYGYHGVPNFRTHVSDNMEWLWPCPIPCLEAKTAASWHQKWITPPTRIALHRYWLPKQGHKSTIYGTCSYIYLSKHKHTYIIHTHIYIYTCVYIYITY